MNRRSVRRGISLLEGIVLVVVMGIAGGVSVEQVRELHDRQQNTFCQDNLRSLVRAVRLYAVDNQGRMPNAVDNTLPRWRWWTDEVFPYAEGARIFYCPVKAPEMYTPEGSSPLLPVIWDHNLLSYGMNYRLGTAHGRAPDLRLEEIAEPEHLILLAESNHYLVRTHVSMWFQDIAPRHNRKANIAFLDGRVEGVEIDDHTSPGDSGEGVYNHRYWQIKKR